MSASIFFHHHDDKDQAVKADLTDTQVRIRFGHLLDTDLVVFMSKEAAAKLRDDLTKITEAVPCESCKGTGVTP